jgi:hypothetical protein
MCDTAEIKTQNVINNLNSISKKVAIKTSTVISDSINRQLKFYSDELEKINAKILVANDMYQRSRLNYFNSTIGLPEYKDFVDVFFTYYNNVRNGSSYSPLVSFTTSVGDISFVNENFEFRLSPPNNNPAWFQLGKKESTENSELIKAWLDDVEQSKKALGYLQADSTTKKSDYGEYTIKTFVKGDMFLTTHFQYERVQGTYGRHSLQYTYFVKVGSTKLNKAGRLMEYSNKLGN